MGFEDIARCICSSLPSLLTLIVLALALRLSLVRFSRRPGSDVFVLIGFATGLEEVARQGEGGTSACRSAADD